ncbi:hypothetical protein LT493_11670 [Streptomyces tricolor]|nr:hypothetical protein [Streptomyces tricolor]
MPPTLWPALAGLTRETGTLVLVGDTAWPGQQLFGGAVLRRAQTVIGVHDSDIPRAPVGRHLRGTFAENVKLFFHLLSHERMRVRTWSPTPSPRTRPRPPTSSSPPRTTTPSASLLDWRKLDL